MRWSLFQDRRRLSESGELNLVAVRGIIVIGLVAIIGAVVLVAFATGSDQVMQVMMALVMIASNVVSGLVGYLSREMKMPPIPAPAEPLPPADAEEAILPP